MQLAILKQLLSVYFLIYWIMLFQQYKIKAKLDLIKVDFFTWLYSLDYFMVNAELEGQRNKSQPR